MKNKIISTPLAIGTLLIIIIVGVYLALVINQSNNTTIPNTANTASQTSSDTSDTSDSSDTSDTSTTSDETTNWQTYTNDDYGFSFKYPSDSEVVREDKVDFLGRITVRIKVIPNNFNPEKEGYFSIYLSDMTSGEANALFSKESNTIKTETKIYVIDQTEATRLTQTIQRSSIGSKGLIAEGATTSDWIFFDKKVKHSVVISYQSFSTLHNQILSTFQFTK